MKHFILSSLAASAILLIPASSLADTLTSLPEGLQTELYSRDANTIRPWGTGATTQGVETGIATEIAFSADGKNVYVKNGVGNLTEGYIVGSKNGDDVTFTFPQTIISGEKTLTVARMIRNTEEGSTNLYIPDPESQEVVFRIAGDCLNVLTDNALIGLLNENMLWTGKILADLSYKKVDMTEIVPLRTLRGSI